jgi:DNA-binding XRE family transcriptional regulator
LTLQRIAPRRAILGAYLWLWNPYIIFMAGMGAHNDAAMVALLLLALFCFSRRWLIAATVAALAGALVKFIPLALIPIIGLIALRELRGWLLVRYLVGATLASGILFIALNAPFWTGDPASLLSLDRRSQLFSGSFGAVLRQSLAPILDNQPATSPPGATPVANAVVSRSAFGLLALFTAWQLWRVWSDRDPLRPYRALALIVMFYMLVSSFWFMPWYSVWLVPLIALLDDSPVRRLGLLFSYLVTWEMILYQYVTLRPTGFAPLPWRDLLPVAVYMGVAYLWIAVFWVRTWWHAQQFRSQPGPQRLAVAASIQAMREASGLTQSQLADEVGWRIDDLIAYERGHLAPSTLQLQQLQQLRKSQ